MFVLGVRIGGAHIVDTEQPEDRTLKVCAWWFHVAFILHHNCWLLVYLFSNVFLNYINIQ